MVDRLLGIMREVNVELAFLIGIIIKEVKRGNIIKRITINLVWISIELID
jgi:hypothetical protein